MVYVCPKHTYTCACRYAHDITQCKSHMHDAYVICTFLFLHVSSCICMYWGIIGAVSSAYVPVCLEYTADIHAHTFTYAFLRSSEGSAYLYVCDCISVCISMQHTCFIQRWSLRACCAACALAARLLRACCAFAVRSPHVRRAVTALVAARSLNVRRAGSACTCAGILPISFGSAR